MVCKGFKPGDRVILKKAFSVLCGDTRDCTNSFLGEEALCEVNRITPTRLELQFMEEVPFFVTEQYNIATRQTDSGEFYITRDFDYQREDLEYLESKAKNVEKVHSKGKDTNSKDL